MRPIFCLIFIFSTLSPVYAQDKTSIQIKTFDPQLNIYPNLELTINGKDFFKVNHRGVAFVDVFESELPPKSIRLKNEDLEPESWNYSRGVLEIIVRKKNFKLYVFHVKRPDNKPLPSMEVTYVASSGKIVSTKTDSEGTFELALPLSEKIPARDDFKFQNHTISKFIVSVKETSIILNPVRKNNTVVNEAVKKEPEGDHYFKDFDLNNIDSIRSLTVFYAIFKNYEISNLSDPVKQKIDKKFKELIEQLQDSVASPDYAFIGKISDSSFVSEDIRNLLAQAEVEQSSLIGLRQSFDEKIQLINEKLAGGIDQLDAATRTNLFKDILKLESILRENELKFYKNQSDYISVLKSMKDKFSDVEDLENKLYESEAQRMEERESFQRMMITVLLIALSFLVAAVLSVYFSGKLKKQQVQLVNANNEIKRINENLEALVMQRTALLEKANREMDTFFYKASHDLRGPVSSIIGLCNLAARSANPESLEIVQRTYNTAFAMDRLLKKLKVISEINQSHQLAVVLLRRNIEETMEGFRHYIRDNKVKVRIECSEAISFCSYSDIIDLILLNLVENSLFYSTLEKKRSPEITVSAAAHDRHVSLSVTDNGVGIEPEIRERIWDMFFIGNERSQGHGLGLYIVRKAVHMLNGHLSIESEVGSFTRISLKIPVAIDEMKKVSTKVAEPLLLIE